MKRSGNEKRKSMPSPASKKARTAGGGEQAPFREDEAPFDYIVTRPTGDEVKQWARCPLTPEYLKQVDSRPAGGFLFQLVECKSSYVKPSTVKNGGIIHWDGDNQVPVVRLYGVTPEGYSVCINAWNFAPYIFINTPDGLPTKDIDIESLHDTLNKAVSSNSRSNWQKRDTQDSTRITAADYMDEGEANEMQWHDPYYGDSKYSNNFFASSGMDPAMAEAANKLRRETQKMGLKRSDSLLGNSNSNDTLIPYDKMAKHRTGLSDSSDLFLMQQQQQATVRQHVHALEALNSRIAGGYNPDTIPLLRVSLRTPNLVTVLRNLIGHEDNKGFRTDQGTIHGPTYESGVRFETRFMVDHNLAGSGWIRVSGPFYKRRQHNVDKDTQCQLEFDANHLEVAGVDMEKEPAVYQLKSRMRIHFRDAEMLSKDGNFPKAETDPIIAIHSLVVEVDDLNTDIASVSFCLGAVPDNVLRTNTQRVICFDNEYDLLKAYAEFILLTDPDIESGYNTKGFDAPYFIDRCNVLGIDTYAYSTRLKNKSIIKQEKVRNSKNMGNRKSWLCPSEGRVEIDMMQYIQDNHKLRSFSLNSVSAHFLQDQKEDVSHKMIPILFRGTREERKRLIDYCKKDTELPRRLMKHLRVMVGLFELARVQGVQIADQQDGMATLKVFVPILTEFRRRKIVVPFRQYTKIKYEGANVFEPKRGFYKKPIVILDYASLYPSEAIAHNLCTVTYVAADRVEEVAARLGGMDKLETCPDGFTYVRSSVEKGVIPAVLERLLSRRAAVKTLMAACKDPSEKATYSGREVALKITANSLYGATAVPNNGIYFPQVGKSITAYGREQIVNTRNIIETEFTMANNYVGDSVVLYGDTDSVMVDFGIEISNWDDKEEVKYGMDLAFEYAAKAAALCTKQFAPPNKLQVECLISPFLLMNKKRYGGLIWNNSTKWYDRKLKGIESVRRDNCRHAARTQEQCLNILFEKMDPDAAIAHARKQIGLLRLNKVDFYDLIITSQLSKDAKDYKNPQAHGHVAELIKERNPGSEPHVGDRVPYVIVTKGKDSKGKDAKRCVKAEDPMYALEHNLEVDMDYYVNNQMWKPLKRIFAPIFGVEETQRRLDSEENRVRIVKLGNENNGLLKYYARQQPCHQCGVNFPSDSPLAKGLLCAQCERNRPTIVGNYTKDLRNVQREYSVVWTNCQNCQGSVHKEVICEATDCPLFFKRYVLKRDLETTRKKLAALSLEW